MINRYLSFLCLCGLLASCATNRIGSNSNEIIHDFFYPEYYSNRPCMIVDTVYLPTDSAYFVKTSFLQIIDTAYEQDFSNYLGFTRPCSDTHRTLSDDLSDNVMHGYNTVLVADTDFTLDGAFIVYSLNSRKYVDLLYPNGENNSSTKLRYGYSDAEELLPHLSFLAKRCDSIAHQYSIVYAKHNIGIDNLSLPMTYVEFIVLPQKDKNRLIH